MTDRKKVLFCIPSISRTGGGVSISAQLQVKALKNTGEIDLSVFTFRDEHTDEDMENWGGVRVRAFKTFGPRRFGFSLGYLLALLKARPDVIHVHGLWQFHCFAVYVWSLVSGGQYIVTPHGMLEKWILVRSSRLKTLVSKLYQDQFLKKASGFQLLTEKERGDLKPHVNGQLIEVIPNYAPAFKFTLENPEWWHEEYIGRDIYLFLGRIHEKKGCIELCNAWELLCKKNEIFANKSILVFCGWNDGLAGFETHINSLNCKFNNTLFAGPQYGQEKIRSLSAASYFVLPSKSEGLPMAILEAWSANVPVIMTNECNLPIGFSANAAIKTGTSTSEIVEALEYASGICDVERSKIVENANELIENHYSESAVGSALHGLYAQIRNIQKGFK